MSLIAELQRRNVIRVGLAYLAGSWLLIQIVETVFPAFGFGDAAVRLVVIVLSIGLVPMLIFAWVFELTPEGLKRERDMDHGALIAVQTARRLDRLIMIVLTLALGYFAFDKFVLDPARDAELVESTAREARSDALVESYGDKSIAVLAFEDLSPGGDQAYFSDGISEELLNLLAKIPELRVAGRTSAFSFKGKDATIAEIGETLNVAHVLEGSVRRSGERIRVTAQLIEARSDTHLWSETFDRDLGDVFAIQDEIAAEVVAGLKITLLGQVPRVRETDPRTYALYLQARSLFNQLDPDIMDKIGALLEQALAIDPEYLPALMLYVRYQGWTGNNVAAEEYWPRIRETTNRALAIDPNYGPVHDWLGWIAMNADRDMATAARHFMRSAELDPTNYDSLLGSINMAQLFGRPDLAIEIGEYMIARDPLCLACYGRTARAYWLAGRLDDAEARVRAALALEPEWISGRNTLAHTLLLRGEAEAALAMFEQFSLATGRSFAGTAMALYDLGRETEFVVALDQLREDSAEDQPTEVAQVYAWIGKVELAFEWLDKRDRDRVTNTRWMLVDPYFSNLHGDPRWQAMLEEYEMSPAQLAAIDYDRRPPEQLR